MDDAKVLLERATARVSTPKINTVWRSAWMSMNEHPEKVQAYVGESHQGFHAGLNRWEPGKPFGTAYGPPMATLKEAKVVAQDAAVKALEKHEKERPSKQSPGIDR